MVRKRVVNASPLILLGKVDKLSLLEELAAELVIPNSVIEEIQEEPGDDPARVWLRSVATSYMRNVGQVTSEIAT